MLEKNYIGPFTKSCSYGYTLGKLLVHLRATVDYSQTHLAFLTVDSLREPTHTQEEHPDTPQTKVAKPGIEPMICIKLQRHNIHISFHRRHKASKVSSRRHPAPHVTQSSEELMENTSPPPVQTFKSSRLLFFSPRSRLALSDPPGLRRRFSSAEARSQLSASQSISAQMKAARRLD